MNLSTIKLWTAIITPMDEEGKIDFSTFESLLRKQEKVGNGIILLGSTGEGMALSRIEKELVIKFAHACQLKVPCLSGLPGHQLEDTLSWISFCKSYQIKGFLAVTPYYSKPGAKGQVEWFRSILNHAALPVMLYHVPSRSGVGLAPEVLSELKDHPSLWALKESSGSVESLKKFQAANSTLTYFCGDDGLISEFAKQGVKGLVSVASNVWPEATLRMVELSLQKKADDFADFWRTATDTLFLASNPIPTKWLLHELGEIKSSQIRLPLSISDLSESEKVWEANLKVVEWFKGQKSL